MIGKRRHQTKITYHRLAAATVLLLPCLAGCDVVNTSAAVGSYGYIFEILYLPLRSFVGTLTLSIINTF
ncbi:MAG: hypothetical protein ACE5F9_14925 [Phycisphaerae bacterium]